MSGFAFASAGTIDVSASAAAFGVFQNVRGDFDDGLAFLSNHGLVSVEANALASVSSAFAFAEAIALGVGQRRIGA